MPWWGWLILAVFVGWNVVFWALTYRARQHREHYSDGCPKPFFEKASRADGSWKNIIPRRGDGEVDDLEHLLEHERSGDQPTERGK